MPDLNTAAQKALDRFSEALTYIGSESFSPSMLAECRASVEELRAALSSRAGDGKATEAGRAAFEAWLATGEEFAPRWLNRRDFPDCERFGDYCDNSIEWQWKAWQAAALAKATDLQCAVTGDSDGAR